MTDVDRLLVSTYQRVFVRELDGRERLVLDRGGPFFGLTWDERWLYVGARGWSRGEKESLSIFDRDLTFLERQTLPTHGQLHQILYHDGLVYLLDTPFDRVVAWNPIEARGEVVLNLGQNQAADLYHFNSLWWADGLFWLVGLRGKLWHFDAKWRMVNDWTYPFQTHNVYQEDGRLFLGASSEESLMVERDGERKLINLTRLLNHRQEPWQCYARGLARGKYLYVGVAQLNEERVERQHGASGIAVFDVGEDVSFVGGIELENTGGMHGLRVLGHDAAHSEIEW